MAQDVVTSLLESQQSYVEILKLSLSAEFSCVSTAVKYIQNIYQLYKLL